MGLWGCGAVGLWGCGAVGLQGCGAVGGKQQRPANSWCVNFALKFGLIFREVCHDPKQVET